VWNARDAPIAENVRTARLKQDVQIARVARSVRVAATVQVVKSAKIAANASNAQNARIVLTLDPESKSQQRTRRTQSNKVIFQALLSPRSLR
jgi:hypothetical protein